MGLAVLRAMVGDPALVGTRVVILTTFELDQYISEALHAGASGFILKDAPPAEIIRAIRVVAAGEALLSPSVTRRVVALFGRQGGGTGTGAGARSADRAGAGDRCVGRDRALQ